MVSLDVLDKLISGISPTAWMTYVLQNKPLVNGNFAIHPYLAVTRTPGSTTEPAVDTIILSVDLGNGAAKIGLVNGQGKFQAIRIPTAYAPAKSTQFGVSIPQFTITSDALEEQESFYIGDYAINGGDALPLGPTHERLANARYRRFFKAALVQALLEARYPAGDMVLAIGLGLRNEEIEDVDGKQTIHALTKVAIKELCGTFTVQYQDMRGTSSTWTITIEPSRVFCLAQTMGSFFAYYHTLEGTPSQNRVKHFDIIDFGTGDTQILHVDTVQVGKVERFTTSSERVGEGTVEIAKGLQEAVYKQYHMPLTLAEAQAAMISKTISYMGQDTSIEAILQGLKNSRAENILGRAMPSMQNKSRYTYDTGGGIILLLEQIVHQMELAGKYPGMYLVAPPQIASIINCLGIFAYAYIRLSRYKVRTAEDQQGHTVESSSLEGGRTIPSLKRTPVYPERTGRNI